MRLERAARAAIRISFVRSIHNLLLTQPASDRTWLPATSHNVAVIFIIKGVGGCQKFANSTFSDIDTYAFVWDLVSSQIEVAKPAAE